MSELGDIDDARDLEQLVRSPQAEEYLERFRGVWRRRRDEILATPLCVCVLGPRTDAQGNTKRKEIAKRLMGELSCTCFFPEEELPHIFQGLPIGGLNYEERVLLCSAELIVALYVSHGVVTEVAELADDYQIADRMLVLIPDEAEGGYAAQGVLRETTAQVISFSRESFEQCRVVEFALRRALLEKEKKHAGQHLIEQAEWLRQRYRY